MERLGCALFMYACTCDALRDLVAFVHLYNLENVKNTHGGVLLLVKLQALAFAGFPFLNCTNYTKLQTGVVKLHNFTIRIEIPS